MNNRELALYLGQSGYFVFPCVARGDDLKKPLVAWSVKSTTNRSEISQMWLENPGAIPAIDCGKSGIIVIDCDRKQSNGLLWLESRGYDISSVPGSLTPGGGRHLYYRNQCGYRNGRGQLPNKLIADIDVKGVGGCIIAPGAIYADGRRYEPIGDIRDAVDLPEWAVELLRPYEPQAGALELVTVVSEPVSDYRRNAYGQAALDAILANVAAMPPGARQDPINTEAFRVGRLVGGDFLSMAEAISRMESTVVSAWGSTLKRGYLGERGTIRNAIRKGTRAPRPELDESPIADISDLLAQWMKDETKFDPETGEVFEEPTPPPVLTVVPDSLPPPERPEPPKLADIPLPDVDWMRPEGLLDEIIDFVLASSPWPNRPLAVASALMTLAPVCGRWLYSPTGSALNFYVVLLAGTGVGKNRPLTAVEQILRAAGLGKLHTTGKAFSIGAVEQMIAALPSVVATVDEIGAALFNRMGNKNNSYAQDMKGAFQELWTRDQFMGPYSNTRRSIQPGVQIKASISVARPGFNMFGVSGPDRFWKTIPPGSIQDGFLNRFLMFFAGPRADPQEVDEETGQVPQSIARRLAALEPRDTQIFSIYDASCPLGNLERVVRRLQWDDDDVRARAREYQALISNVIVNNPDEAELVGRVYEYTTRLASLHAVSRGGAWATVTMRDLEWGFVTSVTSALNLIAGAGRLSNTDYEERYNTVRDAIKDAGEITHRELLRKVRTMGKQHRDEVLHHLVGGGFVKPVKLMTKGRPSDRWKWCDGE